MEERRVGHEDAQEHDHDRQDRGDGVQGVESDAEVIVACDEGNEVDDHLDGSG